MTMIVHTVLVNQTQKSINNYQKNISFKTLQQFEENKKK